MGTERKVLAVHLPRMLQHRETQRQGGAGLMGHPEFSTAFIHSEPPEEPPLRLGRGPDRNLRTVAAPSLCN